MTTSNINGFSQLNPVLDLAPVAQSKSIADLEAAADAEKAAAINAILTGGEINVGMIMAMLTGGTDTVDAQINLYMRDMQLRSSQSRELNNKLSAMQTLSQAMMGAQETASLPVDMATLQVDGMSGFEFIETHGLQPYISVDTTRASATTAAGLGERSNEAGLPADFEKQVERYWDTKKSLDHYRRATWPRAVKISNRKEDLKGMEQEFVYLNPGDTALVDSMAKSEFIELKKKEYLASMEASEVKAGASGATGDVPLDGVEVPNSFSRNQLDTAMEKVRMEQANLNANSEIAMIRLQTAMQQRTQIVTLASNMIKSIQDAEKQIVNNIR